MAKNWAIVVGINQYEFLQPLNYAKRDAELMAQFLSNEAGFEPVFLFSDDSPEIGGKSTRPFRANVLRFFREIFKTPFMGDGDNFWFFFAGHGMRYADRDYLMPLDGDPHDIENTGIPTNYLTERLRRCGADNVVMLLDACRNVGSRAGEGIGNQTAEEARQTGVISIFACSPNQFSHEVESIQQGAFTCALLEGLGSGGRCATVERLNQYLECRVPEILRDCSLNARQMPYTIAEPVNRLHLILMPRYASLDEIAVLKKDAYQAEIQHSWELAEQLWIRIIASASGQDMDAVKALQRVVLKRVEQKSLSSQPQQPLVSPSSDSHEQARLVERVPLLSDVPTQPKAQPLQPLLEDDLSSEENMDYRKLRDLLKAGRWKEADQETLTVMLKVTGREQKGWLRAEDIQNFPCADLRTIDQFWVKYSNGHFGFSVQKKIYLECGGKSDDSCDWEVWDKFGDRVGWRKRKDFTYYWITLSKVTFNTSAPQGHLPSAISGEVARGGWMENFGVRVESFVNRVGHSRAGGWGSCQAWFVLVSRAEACEL